MYVNPHVNSILIINPLSTQYIASFYLHCTQMYMILKCWSLLGHTFSPATAGASKVVTITLLSVTFSKNKCFKSKKKSHNFLSKELSYVRTKILTSIAELYNVLVCFMFSSKCTVCASYYF